jgi:hypothetical protein
MHMESLSGPRRQELLEKVAMLCFLRSQSNSTEPEIAAKLGFGSPEAMYLELEKVGLPRWIVKHEGETIQEWSSKKKRRAGSIRGEAQELPPAKGASELFEQMLVVLKGHVESLEHLRERLQGRRFVAENIYRDPIIWTRNRFSKEQWAKICERFGEDPDSDSFRVIGATYNEPVGGRESPPEPLTVLIATYVLAGLPIEDLLDKLHPDPHSVDLDQLMRQVEGERRKDGHKPGLKSKAEHVARLIRGGALVRGAGLGDLSPREQNAAWYIRQLESEGRTGEEIEHELDRQGFSKEDVARLRNFRLLSPGDS